LETQRQRRHEEYDGERRRGAAQKRRSPATPEQSLARTGSESAGETASLSRLEQDRSHEGDTDQHVHDDNQRYYEAGHPD
jgi:hypothetical protein